MDRAEADRRIAIALGDRRLIWVGYHGADAEALCSLPQFTHSYTLGARLGNPRIEEFSIEERFGQRRSDLTDRGTRLRYGAVMERLEAVCDGPSAIATFVPVPVLDRIEEQRPRARYLGMPAARFEMFNSKPYVEAGLRRFAPDRVRLIDWQPLPEGPSRVAAARERLAAGPFVLRASVSQAGSGHELIRDEPGLAASRLMGEDAVVSGPLLDPHIPLSLGVCVFTDGNVTLHPPSVQLIGLPGSGRSRFGFCGSDFGAVKEIDPELIDDLEVCAKTVGKWLHSEAYTGVFGLDALIHDGRLYFVEINPRFQGSTWLANRIDRELDVPDMVQDHLLAWLGAPSHPSMPLRARVAAQHARSQVLVSNRHGERVSVNADLLRRSLPEGVSAELLPAPEVLVYPSDVMFALQFDRSVSVDGHSIDAEAAAAIDLAERCVELRGRPLRERQPDSSSHQPR